jgi:hypothetical protein
MQLFCDADGVLVDFDTGYEKAFGVRPDKAADNVNWAKIARTKDFYKNLPIMADAMELWQFIKPLRPIILTGIPSSVPEAAQNKREMIAHHFGADVQVVTCLSKEKYLHQKAGCRNVLIDDWPKYQHLWVQAGGIWITHTSAKQTIADLRQRLLEQYLGGLLTQVSTPNIDAAVDLTRLADSFRELLIGAAKGSLSTAHKHDMFEQVALGRMAGVAGVLDHLDKTLKEYAVNSVLLNTPSPVNKYQH